MRSLLAVCVVLLALPAAAAADDVPTDLGALQVTNQRPWTGAMADKMYAAADAYWTREGHPGTRPTLYEASSIVDNGQTAIGEGWSDPPTIWILDWHIDNAGMSMTLDPAQTPNAMAVPRWLCTVVTHELGHVRDAPDSDPVMAEFTRPVTPECASAFPDAPLPVYANGSPTRYTNEPHLRKRHHRSARARVFLRWRHLRVLGL